jgi:hypothetical protein
MHRYTIDLRIYGEILDRGRITKLLGVEPTMFQMIGDRKGAAARFSKSLWAYAGNLDDSGQIREWACVGDGVKHIMANISRKGLGEVVKENNAIWWCGHFQSSFDGGPEFSVAFLRTLAEIGVPIFIDNYFEALSQ